MRKPQKPPAERDIYTELFNDHEEFQELRAIAHELESSRYNHWDDLRHRVKKTEAETRKLWGCIKFDRQGSYIALPLLNKNGERCLYCPGGIAERICHEIDFKSGGTIETANSIITPEHRDRFYINSLIEEATTSSMLEGAATTRAEAATMIRSARKPKTKGEQMVFNNYRAMQRINDMKGEALTPEKVFEIHSIVSKGTLDDPDQEGRFRRDDEEILVQETQTGEILHAPPPSASLEERMKRMCAFANGEESKGFIHPVVRSIILHYWLAYDHPFVDGNGRTARALFYWSMVHHGYWLFEFVSISRILLDAPSKYSRSYLLTQSDNDDLTYFVHYQFEIIQRAMKDLQRYLQKKHDEIRVVEGILKGADELNYRQYALLSHARKHPGQKYTIQSHKNSHGVAYQTARTDLLHLSTQGLLDKRQFGKTFIYISPNDLAKRIEALTKTN